MPRGEAEEEPEAGEGQSIEPLLLPPLPDDEPAPQKLLLAPLLLEQARRSGSASSSSAPLPAVTASVQGGAAASQTAGPGSSASSRGPTAAASSWLRSWWEMAQEGDDEDEDLRAGCDSYSDQVPRFERSTLCASVAVAAAGPRPRVAEMRNQLLTCVRLLKELQAENGALSEELEIERRRVETSLCEVESLRQQNAALRIVRHQPPSTACVSSPTSGLGSVGDLDATRPPSSARSSPSCEPLTAHGENAESSQKSKSDIEAELYRAQVALVVIVEELEGRIREHEMSFERSALHLSEAHEDNKDMLEFFRKRAPGAEQLWQEACVGKNANTSKRRRAKSEAAVESDQRSIL